LSLLHHNFAVYQHGVHGAPGLAIDQLPRRTVERKVGKIGKVNQHEVGLHSGPHFSDLPAKPERMRAAESGSIDCV